MTKQQISLLATEGVSIEFDDAAIKELATIAARVNARSHNIGARRLHTVMERLLEDVSVSAPERRGEKVTVDAGYVQKALGSLLESEDLTRYVL